MKRNFRYALLILAIAAVQASVHAQNDEQLLVLEAVVPERYIKPENPQKQIFTHTNQFRPFIKRKIGGILYTIAYSASTREVVYVTTKDKAFRARDGKKVGDEVEVKKEDFYIIPQLEIRAPKLDDGWEPIVGYDREAIENKPSFVDKLNPGEAVKVRILGFSKGGN